jgi:hypothetical protein
MGRCQAEGVTPDFGRPWQSHLYRIPHSNIPAEAPIRPKFMPRSAPPFLKIFFACDRIPRAPSFHKYNLLSIRHIENHNPLPLRGYFSEFSRLL